MPCGLKNIKEEHLEGTMGVTSWKTSRSIFCYVFSQSVMKRSKKSGCIYAVYYTYYVCLYERLGSKTTQE